VEIRPVRPAEYARAGQLTVAAYRSLEAELEEEYAKDLEAVADRVADAEVLVAVDGDLLGCVTFVPDAASPLAEGVAAGEAAIRMLAVDPGAQRRGVGAALVGACVDRARERGRAGLFLHSTPWMPTAHRLYLRLGFVRVPERDWLPVPEVPLLAFRLDLTGVEAAVEAQDDDLIGSGGPDGG